MAINIIEEDYENDDHLMSTSIEFANGDLEALKKIKSDYGFETVDDALAFAIGFLIKAKGRPVAVVESDGRIAKFVPAKATKKNATA